MTTSYQALLIGARWRLKLVPSLLLSAFCAACTATGGLADAPLQTAPVIHDALVAGPATAPDPKDRIQFAGFSILPPQGEHWVEWPRLQAGDDWKIYAMFWKVVPQPGPAVGPHTVFAQVKAMEIPIEMGRQLTTEKSRQDFLQFVMNASVEADKAQSTGRLRLLSIAASPDQSIGYDCFKYDAVAEDRGIAGFEGKAFTMDFHAYTCLDPALKVIVQLLYSQRVPPGRVPIDLKAEGDSFLKGLSFTTPSRV